MRRGPGRFRDGRRVYQRLSDALNRAAPSSPLCRPRKPPMSQMTNRMMRIQDRYAGSVPTRRPAALELEAVPLRPGAHHLAQDRELAGVIGVVVTDDPDATRQRV